MANTIDKTTDDALLRSIIDGSIEEFEDDTITSILENKFRGCTELEKVSLPNVTNIGTTSFSECPNLKEVHFQNLQNASNTNSHFRADVNLEIADFPSLIISGNQMFNGCTNLKKFYAPNLTYIKQYVFQGCTSLESVNFNNVDNIDQYALADTKIKTLYFPKVVSTTQGDYSFRDWELKYLIMPSWTVCNRCYLKGTGNVIAVDLGSGLTTMQGHGNYGILDNFNPNVFEALIIRSTSVPTLNITNLGNKLANDSTTGTSGLNSTYKIYVPQLLISQYQSATNWSLYSTFFAPIEGSKYDGYYGDGTPIGLSPYGLIGYYAVGESGRYEAIENVPSHINSSVDSDLVAWTHTNGNAQMAVVSSGGTIPSNVYNGYTNAGKYTLGIYSDTAFLSDTDTITLEYSIAVNTDNVSIRTNVSGCVKNGINNAATSNKVELELYGFNKNASNLNTNGSNKMFMHKIVELHSDNTYKVYINGQLEGSNQTYNNISTMNFINVGLNADGCLGPVAIYDRALTSDEIAEHYQFYVDNYMVGQTAYDSSGNFVGD